MIKVYFYYDGPQLFSCINAEGEIFLAMLEEENEQEGFDRWLYIPMSENRLKEVEQSDVSLLDACLYPEKGYLWMVTAPYNAQKESSVEKVLPDLLPAEDLPSADAKLILNSY